MKEKTLVIIIKQKKCISGGTETSTETLGDNELIKVLKESFLQELMDNLRKN